MFTTQRAKTGLSLTAIALLTATSLAQPDLPPLEYEDKNPQVSVFDLLKAVNKVLARIQEKEASTRNIHQDHFSVSEKIQLIRDTIVTRNRIRFTELFQDMQTQRVVSKRHHATGSTLIQT